MLLDLIVLTSGKIHLLRSPVINRLTVIIFLVLMCLLLKKSALNNDKEKETQPALVLDESCYLELDFSLSLMGKAKEFSSVSNLKVVLAIEGFEIINIKYMGGLWVMIEFQSKSTKEHFLLYVGVGSWGDLLYKDDKEETCFHRTRVYIKTKMDGNIFESFKIIVKGKVYWIHAKEVNGWNPDFIEEEDTQTEYDNATIQNENDVNEIRETVFENDKENSNEVHAKNKGVNESPSDDPFHIYDLLHKKQENDNGGKQLQTDDTLKYPPGFTPRDT
ncbi:hypothetical protein Tco_1517135 [Tanacetum coccineum]